MNKLNKTVAVILQRKDGMTMSKNKCFLISLFLVTGLFFLPVSSVVAGDEEKTTFLNNWSKKQMFDPGNSLLRLESKGRITIVERATDVQVEQFMDKQYNRIENFMFVSTVLTEENGEIAYDENTGDPQVEDDDCS